MQKEAVMLKDQDENSIVNDDPTVIENCCARQMDGSQGYELVECLICHPLCNYALTFGQYALCRHPKNREIVEKTWLQLSRVEN